MKANDNTIWDSIQQLWKKAPKQTVTTDIIPAKRPSSEQYGFFLWFPFDLCFRPLVNLVEKPKDVLPPPEDIEQFTADIISSLKTKGLVKDTFSERTMFPNQNLELKYEVCFIVFIYTILKALLCLFARC